MNRKGPSNSDHAADYAPHQVKDRPGRLVISICEGELQNHRKPGKHKNFIEISKKFLEISRNFVEISRNSLESSKKFLETSKKILEFSRNFLEISGKFLEFCTKITV